MDITFYCSYCKQKFIADYDKDKFLHVICPICNKNIEIKECDIDNKQYKPLESNFSIIEIITLTFNRMFQWIKNKKNKL